MCARNQAAMSESDPNDEFFMAGETPGAWLHLTGDPWMAPEDIFSDQVNTMTLTGERTRFGRSRNSVDTLPPYSPPRGPLPTPKNESDVDSDTLPSPVLSPPARKESKVDRSYSEGKRVRCTQGDTIRAASNSKPRVVGTRSKTSHSRCISPPPGMNGICEFGQRISGFGGNLHVQQILKARPLNAVETGSEKRSRKLPSIANPRKPTPLEINDPNGLVNVQMGKGRSQGSQSSSPECPLTPIEMDLGALAMIAALPDPITGTPSVKLKSGALLAILTPEQTCWQRASYLPGPIRLESSFLPASASALTDMDVLQNPISFGHSRTASDDVALDDIVDFFISFGLHDLELPAWSPETPKPNLLTPFASSTAPVFGVMNRPMSFISSDGSSVCDRDPRVLFSRGVLQ